MRISPYQTFLSRTRRAFASKPEFHEASCEGGCAPRSIARSTHSPCGETWYSLYFLMSLKSVPRNASATSHSQSLLVSAVVVGSGFRYSSSNGHTKSRYRFLGVHSERISVRWPGTGAPRRSRSAIAAATPFQAGAPRSAESAKSALAFRLAITFGSAPSTISAPHEKTSAQTRVCIVLLRDLARIVAYVRRVRL